MIENNIKSMSILASMFGEMHNPVRKNLEIGRELQEIKKIRIRKKLEEQEKKVQPVYSSQGKVIEHEAFTPGTYLDVSI
jgi:hypothetical protein